MSLLGYLPFKEVKLLTLINRSWRKVIIASYCKETYDNSYEAFNKLKNIS